ncbi:MAG: hypothetical protein KF729_30430 [Sandaracinaceae bacterium]|nr:hypothetical protein [Sandaracinaceae bacterium]
MSRRNRRKRALQAAPVRTPEALRALAARDPREAAKAIERARRGEGALHAPAAELDDLAAEVAGALRRAGHLDQARRLVAPSAPRSRRAALEEALAAFAAGDDARVAELAAVHTALAPILAPLSAAAEDAPALRKPRGTSAATADLYTAARALTASRAGDHATAARTAKTIGAKDARAFVLAATRLAGPKAVARDFAALGRELSPELTRLARVAMAQAMPRWALSQRWREVAPYALAAMGRSMGDGERLRLGLAELGPEAFERPADALWWRGLQLLDADAFDDAEAAFDGALERGADLLECLRGRWLAARGRCGATMHPRHRSTLVRAGETYARALAKDPRHVALRAAVLIDLAGATHVEPGRADTFLTSALAAVEGTWADTTPFRVSLDLHRAHARFGEGDLAAADAHLERVIATAPSDPETWARVIAVVPSHALQSYRARAFAATRSPQFAPKPRSAGERVQAVARSEAPAVAATQLLDDLPALLDEREAVDVGVLHVLSERGEREAAARYAARRLAANDGSNRAILLTAIDLELDEVLRAHFETPPPEADLEMLAGVAAIAGAMRGAALGGVLLGRLSPRLARRQIERAERSMRHRPHARRTVDDVFEKAHDALHPEICLEVLADSDRDELVFVGEGPEHEGAPDPAFVDALLTHVLDTLGLPASIRERITPAARQTFIDRLLASEPTQASVDGAVAELLGVPVEELARPSQPRKRKKGRRR